MNPLAGRTAVLFDPIPLWLDAVESAITRIGMTVSGKAGEPDVALRLLDEQAPDVFVADLSAGPDGAFGVETLSAALERNSNLRVIVFTAVEDATLRETAFAVGALAYVLKTAHVEDVGLAVRQAFDHSIYFANGAPAAAQASAPARSPESFELTSREVEILRLVSEGHSNLQLARMLWVTEQTIKFHLSNVYRKLEVANRTEASRWAQLHGLLPATAAVPVQAA
jgi:DNA-binding NarL/FixJ family response regulator